MEADGGGSAECANGETKNPESIESILPSVAPTPKRSTASKTSKAAGNANEKDQAGNKDAADKDERRNNQKTEKRASKPSSRQTRSDHEIGGNGVESEVKKPKKEPKDSFANSVDSGSRGTPTTSVNSPFAAAGYSASNYLQGLANLPHPYALFAADPATAAAANAFLTAGHHFGYSTTPTDLSSGKDNGGGGPSRNHSNAGAFLNSLNQTDANSLRQLVNGYREAAALLSRTADELELFLCSKK